MDRANVNDNIGRATRIAEQSKSHLAGMLKQERHLAAWRAQDSSPRHELLQHWIWIWIFVPGQPGSLVRPAIPWSVEKSMQVTRSTKLEYYQISHWLYCIRITWPRRLQQPDFYWLKDNDQNHGSTKSIKVDAEIIDELEKWLILDRDEQELVQLQVQDAQDQVQQVQDWIDDASIEVIDFDDEEEEEDNLGFWLL